jgi:hypothetical protein
MEQTSWFFQYGIGWWLFGFLVFWGACLAFFPLYGVWSSHKEGEADLAKAQNEQMVQVSKAKGRLEAAELNKKAAVIEAEAVALQIEKIGNNLQKHDLYLKWQWIKMMEETTNTTIYVPTEANLPILEAKRDI